MFKEETSLIETLIQRKNQTYGTTQLKKALLHLGSPEKNISVIQIGGTNGKGSTTNFTRSILQASGNKVGTFTSPHLVHHRDRIRINDEEINADEFLRIANQTEPLWDEYNLSMFEIDLIISVLYFIEKNVDVAIYEVGLGGRLDATSVLTPELIGITNVSLDHMAILGDTEEKIAIEKAGIFKDKVPVYSSELKPEIQKVFIEYAKGPITFLPKPLIEWGKDSYHVKGSQLEFDLKRHANYQGLNANLAIELCLAFDDTLSKELIKKTVEKEVWAGRFEEVLPKVYLDGAHNEAGVNSLVEEIKTRDEKTLILFTALKDKEVSVMINHLNQVVDHMILTTFDFPRAITEEDLNSMDLGLEVISPYQSAIDKALEYKETHSIYITGSLYFISLARAYIKKT
ncbi:folylpolyglutamate synthase/dihydrofolate synthase family protein [Erysipelothrix urinaevulpis]|uniref:bifunctional folylpolyglutamate synthase/dihydrofolate synthase n=1 Tax=Erysipelothrix urinaevulpis TaxID=2683717 RepID=UPI0013569FA0|nr:folylpolyglutamate synthase/dihydrofolate synthase family protein [Erysipelothrix urinaevulpis]